jgi:glycine/D-amino acid oxidase-like deaminating enzyme
MYLRSGYPLSLIRNGIPYDYPRLSGNRKTEVAIIGAGITGALCAYYLLGAGLDVVVVDARTVGLGSTCASTSLLLYELDVPLHRLERKIGEKAAREVYAASAAAIPTLQRIASIVDCASFSQARSLYCAATERHIGMLEREFRSREEAGFEVKWLERKAILRRFGVSAPAAILSATAAKTDAYLLTHKIHQYNISNGVKVFDRTTVTGVDHVRGGLKIKTADGFTIRARHVVYATGYETVRAIGASAELTTTYVAASEQLPAHEIRKLKDTLVWNTADPYLYLRTTADNRLLIGGRDVGYSTASMLERTIKHKSTLLAADCGKLIPGFALRTEFSWSGIFGSTEDGMPVIDAYPGMPGAYLALGLGGNGISFSVVAAEMVTALITKGWHSNLPHFRVR